MLNATNALFYFEDIRIYRDHKNMTNRLNNCEQANVDKSIQASNEQLKLIAKLKGLIDIDLLDDKIKEICFYKEKYRDVCKSPICHHISPTHPPIDTRVPIKSSTPKWLTKKHLIQFFVSHFNDFDHIHTRWGMQSNFVTDMFFE